ncbi:MAG: hypothetical protein AB7T49_10555 [Oligoflexales bacterium]
MKRRILEIIMATTLLSQGAAAKESAQNFICENVGGVEEWTIYVDLDKETAAFFDNDTMVEVPLTEVTLIDSPTRQETFTFEGADTGVGPGHLLQIRFNKTSLQGSVVFSLGENDEEVLSALNGCRLDPSAP